MSVHEVALVAGGAVLGLYETFVAALVLLGRGDPHATRRGARRITSGTLRGMALAGPSRTITVEPIRAQREAPRDAPRSRKPLHEAGDHGAARLANRPNGPRERQRA